MIPRSRRQLRKRLLITLVVGTAVAICALFYLLFLFLNFEAPPLAEDIAGDFLDRLMEGQRLETLNLQVEVNPDISCIQARASATFWLPQTRPHLLLHHLFFFMPTDLIFFLHPELNIEKILWGDRELGFRRLKSLVFVNLYGPLPSDGYVNLEICYQGRLKGDSWRSMITPELIYLDPRDLYYPGQRSEPCIAKVELDLPEPFWVAAPGKVAPVRGTGTTAKHYFSFPKAVSAFTLGAVPARPRRQSMGGMDYVLFGWPREDAKSRDALSEIHEFFAERLSTPDLKEIRLIKSPLPLTWESRFDDTGTVLVPPQATEEELAYLLALFWIEPGVYRNQTLFSRQEIARAWSLYFLQERRGLGAYQQRLLHLSRMAHVSDPYSRPALKRDLSGREQGQIDWGPGAYLLSILRGKVGNPAFLDIQREIQGMGFEEGDQGKGWERWRDTTRSVTRQDLTWLLKDWAHQGRTVDLAVMDFSVEERPVGQKVTLVLQNLGSLELEEKVKVLLITANGAMSEMLTISRSRGVHTRYVQEEVIGVVIDPDLTWFDLFRTNNGAYLTSSPLLAMPSEDNRYIAVAYHKPAEEDGYKLAVFRTDDESRQVYTLKHPVGEIEWISDHRLLVHVEPRKGSAPHYLIDTLERRVESFTQGVEISASESGRFLLLNERRNKGWRHRMKDLERNITRPILQKVPYRLEWLSGTDLILPVYPFDYGGRFKIYARDGKVEYTFPVSDDRLFGFHGFEEDFIFLREREGAKEIFILSGSSRIDGQDQTARFLTRFNGEPLDFNISKYGGVVFWKESLADDQVRIVRFDPMREKREILFEGRTEGLYNIFCDKGLLIQRTQRDLQGRPYQDILFHRFHEEEGQFITSSPAPERILALVGNQRYLYYTEEIQAPWTTLSAFNRYRFFRYDFLNHERKELDFIAWSP